MPLIREKRLAAAGPVSRARQGVHDAALVGILSREFEVAGGAVVSPGAYSKKQFQSEHKLLKFCSEWAISALGQPSTVESLNEGSDVRRNASRLLPVERMSGAGIDNEP